MASVSEFSLQSLAKDIVQTFKSNMNEESLTALTKEAVAKESFNRDQASRLIERVNSEAFLSMYPSKTDFPVADPKVVLASLEPVSPDYSNEKVASKAPKWSYRNMPEFEDIFDAGVDKLASTAPLKKTAREILLHKVYSRATEEAQRVEKTAAELEYREALDRAYFAWKDEVLTREDTAKTASEVVEGNYDRADEACKLLTAFTEKLAANKSVSRFVFKEFPTHVVKTSAASTKVAELISEVIACADRFQRFK